MRTSTIDEGKSYHYKNPDFDICFKHSTVPHRVDTSMDSIQRVGLLEQIRKWVNAHASIGY